MKLLSTILTFIFMNSFLVNAQSAIDSSKIVKVLSFNIYHGETTIKGGFDLDRIAGIIKDAGPDFVALQEVDFKTKRGREYDLATELGWRTKLAPLFANAMSFDGGEYGVGILSKHSFIKTRKVPLPSSPDREPRTSLEVITVLASGDTVAFISTHLDHLKDESERAAQVNKINETYASNKYPTILAGDFNAIPGSEAIKRIEELWSSSYDKNKYEFTFPSDKPDRKIDYVFHYPKNEWKVLETKVIHDSIASDHCAYLVTLQLMEK